MSKQKSTREQLIDECDALTASLYGVSYEEYTSRQLPETPHSRAKIQLDMDTRILQDGGAP